MTIVKYFFVGGTAACIDIGLFAYFAAYLGWPWLPVSVASFILATLANYYLSIKFVFVSGVRFNKTHEILGVFLISGIALIINQIILFISIEVIQLRLIIAKIMATGIVFFWNYFGRKYIIFKS